MGSVGLGIQTRWNRISGINSGLGFMAVADGMKVHGFAWRVRTWLYVGSDQVVGGIRPGCRVIRLCESMIGGSEVLR